MQTRQTIEPNFDMQTIQPATLAAALQGVSNASGPERNLRENDNLGFLGRSKPRNQETKRTLRESFTQVALSESYKAKIENWESELTLTPEAVAALWTEAKPYLLNALGKAAFEALLAPCQISLVDERTIVLSTNSEFNRDLILRRYAAQLKHTLSNLIQQSIQLKVVFHQELGMPESQTISSIASNANQTPASPGTQNNSQLSEVALLLERYGDVMGVIDNHPLFRRATAPVAEGGWGLYPQALTRACKEYSVDGDLSTGLEKVIQTIRFTANYRAARNKASFFWAALRNGTRKEA